MAFPTTGTLDTFDRGNEGPPPSASWTTGITSASGWSVVSNQVAPANAGVCDTYWNPGTFGPDSEATIEVSSYQVGSPPHLYVRVANPGVGTADGYQGFFFDGFCEIDRVDNGVVTRLGADIAMTVATGDSVGLEVIGTSLKIYRKTGGTWGSAAATRTDSTYSAAGFIGMGGEGSTSSRMNDFGGGTVVGPALYTVINGTQSQLVNVNAGGTDVDPMTYKASVLLDIAELAALASTAGVFVAADQLTQQMRLIPKRVIRYAST